MTDAVQLLRKTLAGEPDGAVTLIQVGFSTNLARLMESAPDGYSNLSGMDLVKKKVRLLTVMAGNFAHSKPEYNVMTDVPAATKLFAALANRYLLQRLRSGIGNFVSRFQHRARLSRRQSCRGGLPAFTPRCRTTAPPGT